MNSVKTVTARRVWGLGTSALLLAVGALCLFGLIAEDVVEREAIFFDRPLLLFLHGHANPWLDRLMLLFSASGSVRVLVPFNLVVVWWLFGSGQRWRAAYWALVTGGAALIELVAKHIFQRERPNLWYSISPETTFSFPSGHAMQTMAIFVALVMLGYQARGGRSWSVLALLYVFAVGVSRSYLGVHYPSDVLAGWCVSVCWAIGLAQILQKHLSKQTR